MIFWQVGIILTTIKGKLQDFHAGKTELQPQCIHFRCNNTEVFCNHRQLAKVLLHVLEQGSPGAIYPAPVNSGLCRRRYFPVFLKTAEVINANDVE